MRITYPVSDWKFLKYSDARIGLECVKEYLLHEITLLYKETREQSEFAYKNKIPSYLINIFTAKLEERIKHLEHLSKEVMNQINKLK